MDDFTYSSERTLDWHGLRGAPEAVRLRRRSQFVETTAGVRSRTASIETIETDCPDVSFGATTYLVAISIYEEAAPELVRSSWLNQELSQTQRGREDG